MCAHAPGYECVSVCMQVTDGNELSMEVLGSEPRSSGGAARTLNRAQNSRAIFLAPLAMPCESIQQDAIAIVIHGGCLPANVFKAHRT